MGKQVILGSLEPEDEDAHFEVCNPYECSIHYRTWWCDDCEDWHWEHIMLPTDSIGGLV